MKGKIIWFRLRTEKNDKMLITSRISSEYYTYSTPKNLQIMKNI